MSLVRNTAKKTPRLFAVGLLIALVSTLVIASRWESVSAFALSFSKAELSGKPSESNGDGLKKSALLSDFIKGETFLTPGTCDTAGPIEVEGSIAGTTPTAYATLGAAFTAINAGTHTGAITIDVCGDTSEGATTAAMNASGGASSYTSITISPAGGAARTISGATTAGSPMIDFNGADNVTIDGLNTGGNSLTISNTTVSATSGTSTIRFFNEATGNTITNSTILGSGTMSVATNGATIFFSTSAAGGIGNDNNTISNNNIGPAGANLPTKGILCNGSTTSTAIGNSGLVIDNNNIFDYFGAAVTSSGIAVNGGCNTFSVTNNRFYQTGTRTWTTGSIHRAIDLNSSSATSGVQGMTVTGNIIGYASNTQTGVYTLTGTGTGAKFQGIVHNGISTGTTSNINNNTVAAVNMTGVTGSGTSTSSPFVGILLTEGNLISNGNTVGSQSATGSLTFSTTTTSGTDVYGIYNFSSNAWTSNNNNIGGISVTNLGASGTFLVYGMRAFTASTTTWTATSNNVGGTVANSIQLNATGTASQVVGLFTSNAPTLLTSNNIRNLTSNIGTGTTTGASVIGISVTSTTPNHTMSQNTISNLSNTNATAASIVTGIQFTGGTANVVERNFIHSLTSATNSATAEINGIRVAGGTTVYRNNMIAVGAGVANAIGAAASNSGTTGVVGINEALGTNSFWHNSVYIGGSPAAGTGASYAFNGVQTVNARSFRDNIFFNARSNSGATGKNYAVKINGTTANPTGLTINNNIYFANGSGGVFGFFNSLDVANLAAWKGVVGQDANSFESNPQYLDPTNATPDLHLNPAISTVAEGNGADVGVTNDFDGQTRASFTPVDIGADAGNFMGIDLSAPSISYTPFGNTSSTANRTLTVTITDATGVATGGNSPRIYYNKNAGTYFSTGCTFAGGTPQNGTWDCTIDYSLVGGTVATDVIRYFVVAQDTLGNLAANPNGGFTGTNVNTVTTPPTTPNQYLISTAYSGSVNVGTGETITSLTNSGGLFELLNTGVLTGNLVINLTTDLTAETGSVALNQQVEEGAGGYTILFQASGAPRLISGSNTTALINLNGADRVTFSGLAFGPLGLTFRNTSATTGAVMQMTNDASSNSILNCVIEGGNTSTSSALVLFANGVTTGNDNNSVTGSTVRDRTDAAGVPANLIASLNASTTARNSNNFVTDNTLINFTGNGIATSAGATSENWTISGNDISQTATRTTTVFGINTGGMQGTNTVSGNRIHGFISSGSSSIIGFLVGNSQNLTISRNRIYDFQTTAGATGTILGIEFDGASGGTPSVTIVNNMISLAPTLATAQAITGIYDFGFSGNVFTADHNSIHIGGTASGSVSSWALRRGTAAPTTFTARNNIAFNNRTGGTGSHFAVGDQSANTGTFVSDYNIFVGTGATLANYFDYGTSSTGTPVSFAAWQTGPPTRDANSQSSNPGGNYTVANMFVSDTDLHLNTTGTNPALNAGTTLGSVTNDFDGDTRPQETAVEIGADEIVPAAAGTVQFSLPTYSITEGTPTVTLTVTRTGGSNGAVTVNYTLGGGTATGTAACGTPGEDYVNTGGSVIFADGDAADKTFTVPICNDAVYELAQTFDATLAIGAGTATLGTPNPATVTINNDDAAPTVAINDVSQAEGNSGTTNFGFGIAVTGASEVSAGISVQTADNTATQPSDYTALSTPVAIPSDVNRTTTTYPGLAVSVNGDTMFEANETFFMNASGCTDCSFTDNQGVGTIQNDEVQPTVQFSSATYSNTDDVAQNAGKTDELAPSVATITVTRAGAAGDAFSVNYATGGGTATGGASCGTGSGVDYVSTSGTLNFAAGDMSKSFNITVCTDSLFEGDETVTLTLSSPTAPVILGTPNPATLTIVDNETAPTLAFSSATYSNSDDITKYGVTTDEITPSVATITVTRTGAVDNAVSVQYATSNGTATGGASCTTGVDYINTSGTLSFAAGVISQTFNVTVCTDALFEGNETVNLTLSSPSAPATLGTPNSAVLTIIDNDAQPSLQFSLATYSVGEGGGTATITVTRTGAPDNAVSVNYATVAGGTATGGASCGGAVDYQNASGTLSFAAGDLSKTFNVTICDDATAESTETVNLALSSPAGGAVLGAQNTAVLSITDNDGDTMAPTIAYTPLANVAIVQDRTFTVTATDNVGVTAVTVVWRNNDGGVGNFLTNPCSFAGGTAQNGTWTCTILSGVGTQTNPGTVDYFVSADDATANSATSPAGATVNGGTWNMYTIGSGGTINVGTINTFENLVVGNGFTLSGNATVTGNLTLNGGVFNTGANKLTLGCNATVTGGGEANYVVGNLEKQFCATGAFTFNVGAPFPLPPVAPDGARVVPEGVVSNYSPVTVNITGGTVGSSLTVGATDAFLAGSVTTNSASRYWTITESGDLTANISFTYRNEDVNGDETTYKVLKRAGGFTTQSVSSTNNPATNTATIIGVTNFSDWGVGNLIPTAANAEISGRLTTSAGEGIRNATVMLSGGNLTQPTYVRTGTFGNYRFGDLPVGQTYLVTVISQRYTFVNPTRVINLTDSVTDENFVADQR